MSEDTGDCISCDKLSEQVERLTAALKLSREALIGALSDDQPYINASKEALAAIHEVLKGE